MAGDEVLGTAQDQDRRALLAVLMVTGTVVLGEEQLRAVTLDPIELVVDVDRVRRTVTLSAVERA